MIGLQRDAVSETEITHYQADTAPLGDGLRRSVEERAGPNRRTAFADKMVRGQACSHHTVADVPFPADRMGGPQDCGGVVRSIGIARARVKIGLVNLAYNIRRFVWLSGRAAPA